mmetsp:Transcript_4189/g.17200  ORF Transcript_4189/g.17200 Transcript_4189/m.17200 type:complete len:207 (+) Transcript_4189:1492-2112(+)
MTANLWEKKVIVRRETPRGCRGVCRPRPSCPRPPRRGRSPRLLLLLLLSTSSPPWSASAARRTSTATGCTSRGKSRGIANANEGYWPSSASGSVRSTPASCTNRGTRARTPRTTRAGTAATAACASSSAGARGWASRRRRCRRRRRCGSGYRGGGRIREFNPSASTRCASRGCRDGGPAGPSTGRRGFATRGLSARTAPRRAFASF